MFLRLFGLSLAVLCVSAAGPSFAGDPPPAAPPAVDPAPSASSKERDPLDRLVDRLLAADPVVRSAAENDLERASVEALHDIVREMRRRLLAASADECWVPSTVGVQHDTQFASWKADDVTALFGVAADGADTLIVSPSAEVLKRWALAEQSGALQVLSHPRLVNYDGQKGTINILDQRSYIADYELEQASNDAKLADPIIAQVQTGLSLGLMARVTADRARIDVAIDFDRRRLVEPIAEETFELVKGSAPVRVQRPEVVGSRWQRSLSISSGGEVFIVFPRGFSAPLDRQLVLHYRATVVDLSVAGPGAKPEPVAPAAPSEPSRPGSIPK
jgi:hypothetical protein